MTDSTQARRLHPLIAVAAASLILLSGLGIAKMMNWLPATSAEAASAEVAAREQAEAEQLAADAKAAEAKAAEEKAAAEKAAAAKRESTRQAVTSSKSSVCSSCGVITAVTPITEAAKPSGVGAVAGAIVGGVLGHQVGGGSGKKVATVAGAIGGAYAGNVIEGKTRSTTSYQVSVRFEDGRRDSYTYPQDPGVSVGERVRLESGQLVRR